MRKILYKKWIPIQYEKEVAGLSRTIKGTACWEDDYVNEGLFHQWANACNEGNENFGNYIVGLVELEDGSIVEVLPINIKFIDVTTKTSQVIHNNGVINEQTTLTNLTGNLQL